MRGAKSEYYLGSPFPPNSSRHLVRKSPTSKSYRCGRKWRCSFKCAFPRSRKTLGGIVRSDITGEETHHYTAWESNRSTVARSFLNFSPNEPRMSGIAHSTRVYISIELIRISRWWHLTCVLHLDNYLRPVTYAFLVTAYNSYILHMHERLEANFKVRPRSQ